MRQVSEWYGSEFSESSGVGYPSCNRALSRIVRNVNDPNGYYAELGLLPWASPEEIRRALRDAYRRYHPDGLTPDCDKFLRFKEIGSVLGDPVMKSNYDQTPSGHFFVDSEILLAMKQNGIDPDSISVFEQPKEGVNHYDYYSEGKDPLDMINAQRWYDAFISVAPIFGYTKTIRLFIKNSGEPVFVPQAGIIQVPRYWEPNSASAFSIMSCCVVS